jgi:AcrR family transcriptional regulator
VFRSKDGLVRALFREAFHALAADIDALPLTADPEADLIAAGVDGFRGWARRHPDLFRLAFEGAGTPIEPADSEAAVAAFERLLTRVSRCVDVGLLPGGSAIEVGLAFHATCEGLASFEARGRFPLLEGREPLSMWRRTLTALVRGFRA